MTERERSEPDDAPATADDAGDADERVFHCDLCGAVMLNRHCKLRCLSCGYTRDCSDP